MKQKIVTTNLDNLWKEKYLFIKGYAIAKEMRNTIIALSVAIKYHDGQFRKKSGEPYIIHPLTVAWYLIKLGIDDDVIIAAALLHDVVEDCGLPNKGLELVEKFNLDQEVLDIVQLLSKDPVPKDTPPEVKFELEKLYYKNLYDFPKALIVKPSDRIHNCSTLDCFTIEKMKKYVFETKEFVYALCNHGKSYYPEYSNALTIMKYLLVSINESVASLLNMDGIISKDTNRYKKTLDFLKGYAKGKKMNNTLIALSLAERYHKDQLRKSGDPFIIHPLRVCSYLISLKINDDIVCAAALLHEITKKCNLPNYGEEIVTKYHLDKRVLKLIHLVANVKQKPLDCYYQDLMENPDALLIKLSNKANTCTLLTSLTKDEVEKYIAETNNYIIPLCEYGMSYYPNLSHQIEIMQFHICSVCNIVDNLNKLL